jgi:alpha-tubulin suppressor-like RCC1 family protein
VFVWGKGLCGQLGLGSAKEHFTPTPVVEAATTPGVPACRDVSCGLNHTAFVTTDGALYMAGDNRCGLRGGALF